MVGNKKEPLFDAKNVHKIVLWKRSENLGGPIASLFVKRLPYPKTEAMFNPSD